MAEKKRITVDVPSAVHAALLQAGAIDGGGPSTRARLLLRLWSEDSELQERVASLLRMERQQAAQERT